MTTSAIELQELSKNELIHKIVGHAQNARSLAQKHKGEIKRIGTHVAQNATAVVAGGLAGVLQVKLPLIPKTRVRVDLLLASGLALANLADIFEGGAPLAQSAADALTGHGMGRFTEELLKKHGVKAKLTD